MSVIECFRVIGGVTTDITSPSAREHTMKWQAKTDDATATGMDVINNAVRAQPDAVIPLYGLYPGDSQARCKSLSLKQNQSSPYIWEIEAKFDTQYQFLELPPANPLQKPILYQVEFAQFQRVVEKDLSIIKDAHGGKDKIGKPLTNSLGQPFSPAVEQEDSRPVLVAQKNLGSLSEVVQLMQFYKDSVNSRPFYGAKPRQARIKSITAGAQAIENGFAYYPVTIRIEFKGENETWDRELLNVATKIRPKKGAKTVSSKHRGNPISDAVPIDLDGVPLDTDPATGKQILDPKTGLPKPRDPVYLTFRTFPERDFKQLGI